MWYSKFDLKKRDEGIFCPNCNYQYEEQIYYSLDKIHCSKCKCPLLFIRTRLFMYTFNLDSSPSLFIKMYQELGSLPMKEAYSQLMEVTGVFSNEHLLTNYDDLPR